MKVLSTHVPTSHYAQAFLRVFYSVATHDNRFVSRFFLPRVRSSVSLPLSERWSVACHLLRPCQWFSHTVCPSSTGKALLLHHTEAHEYSWFFLPLFLEVPKVYSKGGWQAVNLWQTPANGFPEQKWRGHCSHSCPITSAPSVLSQHCS